ncbi:MAG: YceI family protein [Pirellulaceae bacterium]|nr:YceI family protein [Pirellulaceae bacterium]
MIATFRHFGLAALALAALGTTAQAAETYAVDPVHSSVSFGISHAGISDIHGRFNEFSGKFVIDKDDPSKSSFALDIKVASVDTNNAKRDEHLRAPDYFNAKQFPSLTFQSTKVKATDAGYEVTGDLTLHGVTKPVSLSLKGGHKVVEFPKGTPRIGVTSSVTIKRSEFDMKTELGALGDDVHIIVGLEAAKEKAKP